MSELTLTSSPAAAAFSEAEYYSRQVRLAELGEAGQERLRRARVLVVGAGGLGSPALSYLAAAGVGTLGICEADRLETSNLHRQTLYHAEDVGESKAVLAARRLRAQNPFIAVELYEAGLTPENAVQLFEQYDLVLDCTDNFPAKFLINDTSVLTRTPAIFASIYQFEGQHIFVNPLAEGPCLRCLWPEMPEPGCVGSCAEVGVLGAVPGMLGCMQTMEALKHLLGLPQPLHETMVIFDCLSFSTQRVKLPKHADCPACGVNPRITSIRREEYFPRQPLVVNILELSDERLSAYRLIDIREEDEVAAQPLEGVAHEHIAMSTWDPEHPPVDKSERCLLSCARGMRSLRLAEQYQALGYTNIFSAQDGWQAFHRRVTQ